MNKTFLFMTYDERGVDVEVEIVAENIDDAWMQFRKLYSIRVIDMVRELRS